MRNFANIPRIIRLFFLSLLCMILNIPYGPDAPSRAELQSCSLENGPVVCVKEEGYGYTGRFSVRYREEYRPITLDGEDYDHVYFNMKVFKLDEDEVADLDDPDFRPLYDDDYPGLKIDYIYEVENDPYLIREGDEFTLNVSFVLSPKAKPGKYYVVFELYNEAPFVYHLYPDAVIVP